MNDRERELLEAAECVSRYAPADTNAYGAWRRLVLAIAAYDAPASAQADHERMIALRRAEDEAAAEDAALHSDNGNVAPPVSKVAEDDR